uniref:Uncharacterized protein n=1 Tax=Lactuca sativa TaxID=4236 RepID=A0A9R1XMY2_LACSA|nr:hypothetical protein LSAT_V11C300142120 [Lactuca sativa]
MFLTVPLYQPSFPPLYSTLTICKISTLSAKSSFQGGPTLRTMERSFTGALITRYLLLKHLRTMERIEDFGRNNCRSFGSYFCNGDNSCFEDVNHFGLAFGRIFGSTWLFVECLD